MPPIIEALRHSGSRDSQDLAVALNRRGVGGVELMEYLIDKGADINAREENGLTILGWARNRAVSDEIYGAIVEELLRRGATQ